MKYGFASSYISNNPNHNKNKPTQGRSSSVSHRSTRDDDDLVLLLVLCGGVVCGVWCVVGVVCGVWYNSKKSQQKEEMRYL